MYPTHMIILFQSTVLEQNRKLRNEHGILNSIPVSVIIKIQLHKLSKITEHCACQFKGIWTVR